MIKQNISTVRDPDGEWPIDPNLPELQGMFKALLADRSIYNDRWEDYAGWTLPYVYQTDEYDTTTELQNDYQSVGAQAVNHLTNKITSTLFHPGRSFFKIDLRNEQYQELLEAGVDKTEADTVMAAVEKQSLKQMEIVSLRTAVLTAMKSLIITGNSLLYMPTDGSKMQVFNLRDYVVKRDMSGNMHTLIMRDNHDVKTLPQDIMQQALDDGLGMDDEVELYTGVILGKSGKYLVRQEVNASFIVQRNQGVYSKEKLPWIPLSWNLARGHDYGTGLVEDYSGDFHVLSVLSETIMNMSAIASDIKGLVNPMGTTDIDALNDSVSGTWCYGREEDVSYLSLDKLADLAFLNEQVDKYSRRIGSAFLLNSAVTRNAERVTAEEIRQQAAELEESLGGVYSRLAEELQQPLAARLLDTMDSKLKGLDLVILTGVESLSRTSDLEQMLLFFQDSALLAQLPDQVLARLKVGNVLASFGNARQVEYGEWIKSEEEFQKEQAERAAKEAAQEQMNARGKAQGEAQVQQPQ